MFILYQFILESVFKFDKIVVSGSDRAAPFIFILFVRTMSLIAIKDIIRDVRILIHTYQEYIVSKIAYIL